MLHGVVVVARGLDGDEVIGILGRGEIALDEACRDGFDFHVKGYILGRPRRLGFAGREHYYK